MANKLHFYRFISKETSKFLKYFDHHKWQGRIIALGAMVALIMFINCYNN